VNKCDKPHCHAPGVECDDGFPVRECPHFKADPSLKVTNADTDLQASLFSWTSSALGMDDVAKFATRSQVATVALIGASNAGKTSFLATLYLLLLNGKIVDGYKFAGSFTLGGWEILANKMRWLGQEPPNFPDHTPRGISRQPGLLHLALRDKKDRLCDVVFADAPGEWFERWAIKQSDPQAEGARWLEQHADSVLIFLDSEKMSSPEHWGKTRSQSRQLLSRSFESYSCLSIGIVWAKHDTFKQNQAIADLQEYIKEKNIEKSFNTIAAPANPESQDVLEAAIWSIQQALEGRKIEEIDVPINIKNPFLAFRGRLA
jgi:Double-GTPase 2